MTAEAEQALLAKARRGDTAAFEAIVLEYERPLYALALHRMGNAQDAADAVQETFLKAYLSLSSFRGEGRLRAWLCRIAQNECTDLLRKRRDTVSLTREDETGAETELADPRTDPAALLEQKETASAIRAALGRIPEEQRVPLLLREYGGLNYQEISAALSVEPNTVKTRIFRARQKLRAFLCEDGNFFADDPSEQSKGGARE
ncbi:MAG: RNA polymerase sigma factor [Oscillospiraceae bacterium]|nr:RNA polymerase sigma factor [Oscillospiraceae bacterium]